MTHQIVPILGTRINFTKIEKCTEKTTIFGISSFAIKSEDFSDASYLF